jgi:hypothetical protein
MIVNEYILDHNQYSDVDDQPQIQIIEPPDDRNLEETENYVQNENSNSLSDNMNSLEAKRKMSEKFDSSIKQQEPCYKQELSTKNILFPILKSSKILPLSKQFSLRENLKKSTQKLNILGNKDSKDYSKSNKRKYSKAFLKYMNPIINKQSESNFSNINTTQHKTQDLILENTTNRTFCRMNRCIIF